MQQKLDFGSLLTPISQRPNKLQLNHLIASTQQIKDYLSTIGDRGVNVEINYTGITPQPTPMGLALLAKYYTDKNCQSSNIWIASSLKDMVDMLVKVSSSKCDVHGTIILQATDNHDGKYKHKMMAFHKLVLHFKKEGPLLRVLFADSTPFEPMKFLCSSLLKKSIPNTIRQQYYYTDNIDDPVKKTHVFFQTDFWSCGTHAFRLARIFAKNNNFFDNLTVSRKENDSDNLNVTHNYYSIPKQFAKCIDNEYALTKYQQKYQTELKLYLPKFSKYSNPSDYINKFNAKYLNIIREMYNRYSSSELSSILDEVDAKNYQTKDYRKVISI